MAIAILLQGPVVVFGFCFPYKILHKNCYFEMG